MLCLTAAGKFKEDVQTQKSQLRVGLNSDMQWVVYNFPLKELGEKMEMFVGEGLLYTLVQAYGLSVLVLTKRNII